MGISFDLWELSWWLYITPVTMVHKGEVLILSMGFLWKPTCHGSWHHLVGDASQLGPALIYCNPNHMFHAWHVYQHLPSFTKKLPWSVWDIWPGVIPFIKGDFCTSVAICARLPYGFTRMWRKVDMGWFLKSLSGTKPKQTTSSHGDRIGL